ncbi:hypothetical protein AD929_02975 [Gluconobacter potus]|uniref:Uncharacterized protein n=1 Tax=Gluconobacter potus TaxID=2724927 RepID=A0A149QYJ1_9PROT|nr:hypothetical protein [Gluconobacter potus]KXV02372.1 hypothetical protein AD929_02975 [Gluconobacter potus]
MPRDNSGGPNQFVTVRDLYNAQFMRDQFEELTTTLAGIKGWFVLSLNDRPEVREILGRFDIEVVDVEYSINRSSAVQGCRGEIFIIT